MSRKKHIDKGHLIIDCGGTKASWLFEHDDYSVTFKTTGYNPYAHADTTEFKKSILATIDVPKEQIANVYFYGAGCNTPSTIKPVNDLLSAIWPRAEINVAHDLLGAARASCGNAPGIVCILGTGSNSCYYDGHDIAQNIPSLGYLLGDEGSGAAMGKAFLKAYLRDELHPKTKKSFETEQTLVSKELMFELYNSTSKSKDLAKHAKFIKNHLKDPEISKIAKTELNAFFLDILMNYDELEAVPVHFTGSISFYFKKIIKEIADSYEITIGSIYQSPMQGLVKYHRKFKTLHP